MGLIAQEVSQERWIEIPGEVRDIYRLYRPSPLFRARAFEEALDTPARIYYKSEHVSPVGSHKLNTAIMQAWVNKQEGVKRLATETGAGQWGSALACACRLLDLECMVYMVRVSYDQKPYRRIMMKTYGADVVASPSPLTAAGRAVLAEDPDTPGSLGMAISEAVEDAAGRDDTKYALGSVLNHVLLHQTIIGQEAKKQMERAGDYPDILVGCHGGGSNFAGLVFPFLQDKLAGSRTALRAIAVEPSACPSLTVGAREYDFGDRAGTTPLLMMHTLGHAFTPAPVHAGGLRYHGSAPLVSHLLAAGVIEAEAYHQADVFESAVAFARCEGTIPAPESAHAIHSVVRHAREARAAGRPTTILFNLSGHGLFDLAAYDSYISGKLDPQA
jgi:tryptophan synthase beta chain